LIQLLTVNKPLFLAPLPGKAFSVLATREGLAMVPLSTGGDSAKLEHVDEDFHEGILLAG
jgi:hypothetical protein